MSSKILDVGEPLDTKTTTTDSDSTVPETLRRSSQNEYMILSSDELSCNGKPADYLESAQMSKLSRIPSTQYGDVPFDEFELQVQELSHLLWPTSTADSIKPSAKRKRKRFVKALRKRKTTVPQAPYKPRYFAIEHMRGGGYNRVAAINILGQSDKVETQMVLRVPRMGTPHSDQDVVNLQFVRGFLPTVPTPEIIAHDFSDNNPLGKPYVIQKRLSGHDLESIAQPYPDLSHTQKLAFVREFCRILLDMQKVQHPWAGQINKGDNEFMVGPFEVASEADSLIAERAEVIPFFKPRPFGVDEAATADDATDVTDISDEQTPLHFFEVQFARWRNVELGLDPSELWQPSIWQRLMSAATEMWESGCLDYDSYCLTHYDLDPRNIMVDIRSDGSIKVTGIIDWDLACFAPDWVDCKPPMWIWNWLDGGSEDESKANEPPPNAEQRELKDLFDKLVGPVYAYNAYEPHYRLARQMFKFARYGLRQSQWREEAEKVLKEWEQVVYPDFQAKLAQLEKEVAEENEDVLSERGENPGYEQVEDDQRNSNAEAAE